MTSARPLFPSIRHTVTQDLINAYADLAEDWNPLHVDPAIAALSPFGSTIAHGPIALQAFFEAVTLWEGVEAMPPGSSVKVVYRSPVRAGDEVRCDAFILDESHSRTTLEAVCTVGETTVVSLIATVPRPEH